MIFLPDIFHFLINKCANFNGKPTKFTTLKVQKIPSFGLFLGEKSIFCDFTPENSFWSTPNHSRSILWLKIGLGNYVPWLSDIEQKIPVRPSTTCF